MEIADSSIPAGLGPEVLRDPCGTQCGGFTARLRFPTAWLDFMRVTKRVEGEGRGNGVTREESNKQRTWWRRRARRSVRGRAGWRGEAGGEEGDAYLAGKKTKQGGVVTLWWRRSGCMRAQHDKGSRKEALPLRASRVPLVLSFSFSQYPLQFVLLRHT
jgi:hypothetical protein